MIRRSVRNGLLAIGVAAAAGAADLAAQVPDTVTLAPIVVSATQTPLPLDRLGARVTVLTADDLRAGGFVTVAEALEGLAGLTVVRNGGPGAVTSVFVRGGESDYVKVLVDGVPLNEPGGAYDFAHLTVDNVERIEIVRGPTSVVSGSDAVSGVVHLVTRRNGRRFGGGVRGGTYGTMEADADLAGGTGAASYALTGAWRRSDGLYDLNSGYENATLAARVHVAPAARTGLDLSLRTMGAEYRYPTDGAGNVVDANQRQRTTATTIGLELRQRLHDRLGARLALRGNAIGGGFDDDADGPADTLGFYAFRTQRDLGRRQAEARLDWAASDGLTVTTGAAYEHQHDRSTSEVQSEFGPSSSATDVTRHNWAGFAEASWLARWGSVTAGTRVDRNERFGTFVTWRATASARAAGGLRVFATGGNAFKEPTFFEQFGGSFVSGNPDLAPERALAWEAGLEQTLWNARVRLTASYFGQRFRDLIQYSAAPPSPGGPNYVNIAAARADGLEAEAAVEALPGLRLGAQYTYLHTEVTDGGLLPADDAAFRTGAPLLRRPGYSIGGSVRWDGGLFGAATFARWTGSRADADFSAFPATRVELPSYLVVDVAATVRPLRDRGPLPGAALELQVRNVFDEDYQAAYGFPAPGRTILFGVRVGS